MTPFAAISVAPFEELAHRIEGVLDGDNQDAILGSELTALVARIPTEAQVTPGALVRLALLNDALCLAERVMNLDGVLSERELAFVEPLVREVLHYLPRFRSFYRMLDVEGPGGVANFLKHHTSDGQKFGGRCRSTAFMGLSLCQRFGERLDDPRALDDYRDLLVRLVDDLFEMAGSGSARQKAAILDELAAFAPPATGVDPREAAYCAPDSPEVFHAVAHGAEVFEYDPFDVDRIHAPARAAFERLLDRAAEARFGKILLVKGVAGSGKTHLMRAFRNQAHGEHLGFVAYLQLSTRVSNYAQYILANLIDSWDRPYWAPVVPETALACLSDAVAQSLPLETVDRLRDDETAGEALDELVNRGADRLLRLPAYSGVHVDVLRMMLYLQNRDPALRSRVLKFLRCEPLTPYDQKYLGHVAPFAGDEAPAKMLTELGGLVAASGNGALVLLVDQLEDVYNLEDAEARFRIAMDALRHVSDHVPSSVIVVACLDDFYTKLRSALAQPVLERIELDPDPIHLQAGRSLEEIEELVQRRLHYLFDRKGVPIREEEPLYPFTPDDLAARVNQRTRDILDWCRQHHQQSIAAGRIVDTKVGPQPQPEPATNVLAQSWNDHRSASTAPPNDEGALMQLLAESLERLGEELGAPGAISAKASDTFVSVTRGEQRLLLGLCDRTPRGGALAREIEGLIARAKKANRVPVVLRTTEYPPPGKTKVADLLKQLIQGGGRKVVLWDADFRTMQALRTFRAQHAQDPAFAAWLASARPLCGVTALREILALESLTFAPPAPIPPEPTKAAGERSPTPEPTRPEPAPVVTPQPPVQPAPKTKPPTIPVSAFVIGETRGLQPHPVRLDPKLLTTHCAFLGSSGSGKTTLALNVLEHLLEQRIPVLMVDRKGDLATYATDSWKQPSPGDPNADRRRALAAQLDVQLFTPGEPRGNPLKLPVIPSKLGELPAHERGILARYAASALGAMMGYKNTQNDQARLSILGKAIEVLGHVAGDRTLDIGDLTQILDDEDPDLVSAIGRLDTGHFRKLIDNLETLRLRYEPLLRSEGPQLSPELLFGMDEHANPDKTRLTIISTKFLGDVAVIDFWVARLLGELSRWASRRPADSLQAALFLDEADIYLPALSKPATKEPMLDLLKRARSAGLGVFLATQSPGDLDYRCRDNIQTWFVGRVAERTAVEKMKPLLSECRTRVDAKLAQAKTGEFFKIQAGDAIELKAHPSLMKTRQLAEDEILTAARERAVGG
ncbi:MAG: DUF2791 family P-loop domain-containing protein [Pseudomonadota bacterium]